jgi:molybdate transport system regulatory protein
MKKSSQPIPSYAGALRHAPADKRIEILRLVGKSGSISQAAREAGVSYKAAWQAVDTLSNLAGVALLVRAVGGVGGGGARLTSAGEQLLDAARQMDGAQLDVLQRFTGGAAQALSGAGLRTSMRNQLPCAVKALKRQGQALRVQLSLRDGTALYSRVTRESAELLGLQAGQSVLALCKATAVDVSMSAEPVAGRNLLQGFVTRVSLAAAGGEVALELHSGLQLVGFTGPGSGLKKRAPAVALVDESAVVIAVTA